MAYASEQELKAAVANFSETFLNVEREVCKVIVGQKTTVRQTLMCIFAGGHVLLEGVPGLGKTLLVKSIARSLGLSFKRVQFTPDLMPSDVTGTQVLSEDDTGKRRFVFKEGPLFANVVLADEINRATPKTQAALLEAMEERQVTVLGETHLLPVPFFVLATQNPVELEGTYPLPEAQLDRFMMKILVPPPTAQELKEVLIRTTGAEVPQTECLYPETEMKERIASMRKLVREVTASPAMLEIISRFMSALTPQVAGATEKTKRYVRFGPGPRGAQALMLSAKVSALLDGRINVSIDDIRGALIATLRHRLILNFQAEADHVTSDGILEELRTAK